MSMMAIPARPGRLSKHEIETIRAAADWLDQAAMSIRESHATDAGKWGDDYDEVKEEHDAWLALAARLKKIIETRGKA